MALDPNKQESFLNALREQKKPRWGQGNWDYFWRVVHLRCLRELFFMQTDKYADSLFYYNERYRGNGVHTKQEIVESLNTMLKDSIKRV